MRHLSLPLVLLASVVLGGATCIRSIPNTIDPIAPSASPCVTGAWRCANNTPEVCETDSAMDAGVSRWWATTPRRMDGTIAPCADRCVIDEVAHCATGDAGHE